VGFQVVLVAVRFSTERRLIGGWGGVGPSTYKWPVFEDEEKSPREKTRFRTLVVRAFSQTALRKKRFSFREQPFSSACDLNRRTNLDGSKQRKEVFKQKEAKAEGLSSRKKRLVATVGDQCF
jgi:hypothetical protein